MNPLRQKPTLVFEMLDSVERQTNVQAKVNTLASLRCFELNSILQINFRPDIRMELPPGAVMFQRDNGDPDQSLRRTKSVIPEFKELDVRNRQLQPAQKLKKFIAMLESVNEREAEVFILAKDKKLQNKWKSINLQLVRRAIPGIV